MRLFVYSTLSVLFLLSEVGNVSAARSSGDVAFDITLGDQLQGPFVGCKDPLDVKDILRKANPAEMQKELNSKWLKKRCRPLIPGPGEVKAYLGVVQRTGDGQPRCIIEIMTYFGPENRELNFYVSVTTPTICRVIQKIRRLP